jgi:kynurenine formamidase
MGMQSKMVTSVVLLGTMMTIACISPDPSSPKKIIDLSPTISEDLPVRMLGPKLLNTFGFRESTVFDHIEGDDPLYYLDSYLTLFNHAGPHHDAPCHLTRGAKSSDEFELGQFFGPARVLDFGAHPDGEPIRVADLERHHIQAGSIVIAYVGYVPPGAPDELPSYPHLSRNAAEYLATLPVKAFATDAPGVDDIEKLLRGVEEGVTGYENLLPVHHALLSRDVPVIEQPVNLEPLIGHPNIILAGFPLKIGGQAGCGAPMRAAALVY